MIHLIMVLSTIMLASCTTMDTSSHSLDTRPTTTSANLLHLPDELSDTADSVNRRAAPHSLHSLKRQLSSSDLMLSSRASSVTSKSILERILAKCSSRLDARLVPLSKTFRRRRIYQQNQEKKEDDVNWIPKPLLEEMTYTSVQPSSLKVCQKLLHKLQLSERAVLKRKRTHIKNAKRIHNTNGKSSDIRTGNVKRENRTIVSYNDRFPIDDTANHLGNSDDNSNTKRGLINKRTTMHTRTTSSYKVKRSISSEIDGRENSDESVTNDNKTNSNISSRDTLRGGKVSSHSATRNAKVNRRNATRIAKVSGHNTARIANNTGRHTARHENDTNVEAGSPDASNVRSNINGTTTRRGKRRRRGRRRHRQSKDLSLWIDERQVKLFSGYMMEIYAIHNGRVLPYILDPNFEKHLPIIPFEVKSVNFTWQAGRKRYYYTFDRLYSHDQNILQSPIVSLPSEGRVPRKPKVFTVNIFCTGNASGIAAFDIGLLIQTRRGKPMPGTPLRLKLRKDCTQPSPDPECDEKCENGGVCDLGRRCQCPEGYMGQYCNTALCYPQCMNGGTCTTPGRCTCPPGYQGRHCEGGMCRDKCENGGKCIQKDTCACPRGYYGNRCEFSKCVIPCINGGRCRNVNKCRCPHGFAGDHCEVVTGRSLGASAIARCSKKCRHGSCMGMTCQCQQGYAGRWCRRRGGSRNRVWL